ncbi:MAG TPA: rhodanese-like domain-containing protein [Actinomycetales bacterium]|nr:rhodanese-like domain-containing protein [Actinomycetales bacterium]
MSYAGDLTPSEAWKVLADDDAAVLVDCRTRAEWGYVGVPDLSGIGKQVVLVELQTYPDGARNPHFVAELQAAGVGPDTTAVFICRSGARSAVAAAMVTGAGLGPAYNVADGFEGQLDGDGHRGVGGWRSEQLPWRQS